MDRGGWLSLVSGLVLAAPVLLSERLSFIFHYFVTLVHELGHSAAGWLFGYPSIPAFDFSYGGGVAVRQDQRMWIVWAVYVAFAWCLARCRREPMLLGILAGVAGLYSLLTFTSGHEIMILFMGHGTELVFAGIFLYRAMSGSAIVNPLERPLYAFIAFFTLLSDTRFAWRLMTDEVERIMYGFGKGGHAHDFVRIADLLHVDLRGVAATLFACCLVTPVAAIAVHRYLNRTAVEPSDCADAG